MLFIYDLTSGDLVSTYSYYPPVQNVVPQGCALLDRPEITQTTRWTWDSEHRRPVLDKVRATLSQLEFTRRFSMAENVALNAARLDPNTPIQTRATLETLRDYLQRATNIDVTDADTIAGATAAVDILIGMGLVNAGEREQRIAQVLELAEPSL